MENLWEFFKADQHNAQPLFFGIALVISFLITPLIRERALEMGLLGRSGSEPGDERERIHKTPVPRLGGIAILLSVVITSVIYLAIYGRYSPAHFERLELEAIAVGALLIFLIGLLDDIKPLGAWTKLGGQVAAASITWLMGMRIEFLANPVHYVDHARIGTLPLDDWISFLVTVFWLVAITNAINLLDGIDGLAVGVCLIASIATWAITMSPTLNQPAGAMLAATIAGASLGFLRYNFNPARIFLGDNGSYLLGFVMGCISCVGLVKKVTVVIISPVLFLIFLVPLLDTIYAIYRRVRNKKPIMKADLGHFHHKLLDAGFTQKQVNFLLYSVTFIGGLIGSLLLGKAIFLDYLYISAAVLGIGLFFSLGKDLRKNEVLEHDPLYK